MYIGEMKKGEEKMYSCQFSVWLFTKNTKPSLGKEEKTKVALLPSSS